MKKILCVFVTGLLFTSCREKRTLVGPAPEGGPEQNENSDASVNSSKDPYAECEFQFDEGLDIDLSLESKDEVKSLRFQKQIYENRITPLLAASGASSLKYVETKNVKFFKVPRPKASCRFFATLPEAPTDFLKLWRDTEKAMGGGEFDVILGMFLPQNSADKVELLKETSVIGVLESTDRWTLVHEFMHHEFEQRRVENSGNSEKLKEEFFSSGQSVKDLAKAFESNPSTKNFTNLVLGVQRSTKAVIELSKAYALEEVSIESYLQENHEKGIFKTVKLNKSSSDHYIVQSAHSAMSLLNKVAKVLNSIEEEALYRNDVTSYEKNNETMKMLNDLKREIYQAIEVSGNRELFENANALRLQLTPFDAPCSRMGINEQIQSAWIKQVESAESAIRP